MSVHVSLLGRLGNNLFQYAVGRIIAEHHGLRLDCTQVEQPGTHPGRKIGLRGPATLTGLAAFFPAAPLHLPGRAHSFPVQSFELRPNSPWNGQAFDLEGVLADRTPRAIRLAGYFQRFEYLEPHQDRIRSWFRCETGTPGVRAAPRDVLVNIRRGADFGQLGWTLPMSYYRTILHGLRDVGRVYVCGTGIDAPVRRALAEFEPAYLEGTPREHFAFFAKFDRLILSNSTFAWWAAFLSDASEIHAPRTEPGGSVFGFTGWQDVDLHLRSPRYREVPVRTPARYTAHLRPSASGTRLWGDDHQMVADPPQGNSIVLYGDGTRGTREFVADLLSRSGTGNTDGTVEISPPTRQALVAQMLAAGLVSLDGQYLD